MGYSGSQIDADDMEVDNMEVDIDPVLDGSTVPESPPIGRESPAAAGVVSLVCSEYDDVEEDGTPDDATQEASQMGCPDYAE